MYRQKLTVLTIAIMAALMMTFMLSATSYASRGSNVLGLELAGVSAYLFSRGDDGPAIAAAAGAAIALSQSDRDHRYYDGGYSCRNGYGYGDRDDRRRFDRDDRWDLRGRR